MTTQTCIDCGKPLPPGATNLCANCVSEALARFEEYEQYAQEEESDENDWADDCGFDLDTGRCDLDGTEYCMFWCPYRQAIGDVAP